MAGPGEFGDCWRACIATILDLFSERGAEFPGPTARPQPDPAAAIAAAANAPEDAPDMTGGDALRSAGRCVRRQGAARRLSDHAARLPQKKTFYFLDFAGQLIDLGSEFRKGELMALFGTRMGWLDTFWPQWKKVGERDGEPQFEKDGFSQKFAQQGLIMACSKRGLFDPKGKVRGRGAHRGDGGELVLHCGDVVLVGGRKGVKRSRAQVDRGEGGAGRRLRLSDADRRCPDPTRNRRASPSGGKSSPCSKHGTGSGARSPRICCCVGCRRRCSAARCASARMAGSSGRQARARRRCSNSCGC
jgi:hypothetical protein